MRILTIQKKSGGVRKIYAPNKKEKKKLKEILKMIPQPAEKLKSAHGFMAGRSPVTNALEHMPNYRPGATMISMDLSDFFGRVTPNQVLPHLSASVAEKVTAFCFPDGAAQQGLPTSPAIANLAGIAIDEAIRRKIKRVWTGATYTRYADDISISFPAELPCRAEEIIEEVKAIAERCGHRINNKKTRVQPAKAGRWECCGVMIDEKKICISRKQRRKLRMLRYLNDHYPESATAGKVAGLEEWSRLRAPITEEEKREREMQQIMKIMSTRHEEAQVIANYKGFPTLDEYPWECKPDIYLPGGAIITRDPVMIYGMSYFTTKWTSCMDIGKRNNYSTGAEFWRRLKGVSIAYIPGKGRKAFLGITRQIMKERALVFECDDGKKYYGTIYPYKGYKGIQLGAILKAAGYIPCNETGPEHKTIKVLGEVTKTGNDFDINTPYFDWGGLYYEINGNGSIDKYEYALRTWQ